MDSGYHKLRIEKASEVARLTLRALLILSIQASLTETSPYM